MKRTDIHRPSAIQPSEYVYIGYQYSGNDPFAQVAAQDARRAVEERRRALGALWSGHEHGGTCHVCGAHAVHLVVWHHRPTNTFIRTGEDCADKMDLCLPAAFRDERKDVDVARRSGVGYRKAAAECWQHGVPEVFAYTFGWLGKDDPPHPRNICANIVQKLVQYGSLSDKQWAYLKQLVADVPNHAEKIAQKIAERKAESEAAAPAPAGRVCLVGTVLSIREPSDDAQFPAWKMLIKAQNGFKVWMTVPSNLSTKELKGKTIRVLVTLKPSLDDTKFAFGSRPAKAEIL